MNENNGAPGDIRLYYDDVGRLVLVDAQGVQHAGVEPVRGFPISDPDHWISVKGWIDEINFSTGPVAGDTPCLFNEAQMLVSVLAYE